MSTSHPSEILAPQGPTRYEYITYQNSANARRRWTCSLLKPRFSQTVVRSPQGEKLPHVLTKAILRTFRSKYRPHFGDKQRRKLLSY